VTDTYDLAVVGAGPGGYVAAARAAQLGMKTVLIEKDDRLGGTCLLRGCIPTKALIHAAEVWQLCRKGARTFGVTIAGAAFDWTKVQKRKELAITKGSKGVVLLMQEKGVTVMHGHGRLAEPGRLEIEHADGSVTGLLARKIILATGSTTASLPNVMVDGERIVTSDHLIHVKSLPASLIVLGAGAVGVELAVVMATFGCQVILVEMLPQVLPLEDPECGEEVARYLKRQGLKIFTGTRAEEVTLTDTGVKTFLLDLETRETTTVEAEMLLVAVGRKPVTEDLGFEKTNIATDRRGFVVVDAMMQTSEPGHYAIGDIVATPQLAHLASREALVAAGHAAGRPLPPIEYDQVPSCTYSNPEVASVGLTEAEASNRGHQVRTGKFPFAALGKASILNEPHGFVKVVIDTESDRVLGVQMVGPRVTELIAEATAVMGLGADTAAWSRVIHPHPTLSESISEAARDALGRPIYLS